MIRSVTVMRGQGIAQTCYGKEKFCAGDEYLRQGYELLVLRGKVQICPETEKKRNVLVSHRSVL